MKKLRVGIIFGGKSTEHEVSLQSAKNIIDTIDKRYFEILLIGIDKQGQWCVKDTRNYLQNANNPTCITLNPSGEKVAIVPGIQNKQLVDIHNLQSLSHIDVIFPIVHGAFGEDGTLQGTLRMANLPFVGSDVQSSATCMDKDVSKRLLRDAGLNIAPFVVLTRANYNRYTFSDLVYHLGLPLLIKPANQGSSVGISKVSIEAQFCKAIDLAFEFDHKILIEQNVKGREIECALLGNDEPQASTCGEVVLNCNFYSYNDKYINNKDVKLVIPAALNLAINDKIREISIKAYQTLGCCGMARVDVFLTSKNKIIINEVNTLPGFTKTSMYPKLWQASGINCQNLITRLIKLALEKHATNNMLKSSIMYNLDY